MQKILLLAHFLVFSALASSVQPVIAEYDISYAIFGKIGETSAKLDINEDQYTIMIEAKASGIAKLMSHSRTEFYESKGIISDDSFIPLVFTAKVKKGDRLALTHRYHFDYENKQVRHLEILGDKQTKDEILPYFAHNDILTLFFNLKSYLKEHDCADNGCTFSAIGANEKDAQVDIYNVNLESNDLTVVLHREIFASKEGKIDIHMTPRGLCSDALLKDVIFFGDVKAKATKIIYK